MSRYSKINKKYHDNSFIEYTGPSHSQGGVKDSGIEYEGGETKYKDFTFSNRLKAAEGSMSAQSKKIFSKYKKKNDFMSRMSKQAELGEIAAIGEKLKAAEIAKQEQAMQAQQMQQPQQGMPMMAFGGFDPQPPAYTFPEVLVTAPPIEKRPTYQMPVGKQFPGTPAGRKKSAPTNTPQYNAPIQDYSSSQDGVRTRSSNYDSTVPMRPKQNYDSVAENILEVFDPTGMSGWDDASRAMQSWDKRSTREGRQVAPTFDETLDMVGALPLVGKAKYAKGVPKSATGMIKNTVRKSQNAAGAVGGTSDVYYDNVKPAMPKMAWGGFAPAKIPEDGVPMEGVEPLPPRYSFEPSLPPAPQVMPMSEPTFGQSLSKAIGRVGNGISQVPQVIGDAAQSAVNYTGNAINAIGESGVINDSSGIAASMVPMMFRTMDALTDKPEQVPLFQNQQMYNSMDLMNNRIDSDAMLAESERQANAGRLANVSRSAQVNNAIDSAMYANQQAQNQQAMMNVDMQNAQFRGQEAQMRAQMGAQDREYRAQQDDLQARTDAAAEQRKDAGAQSLFNLVGTNLSQKRYLADSLKNRLDIARMQLATQEKIAQMLNSNAQMSPEFIKLLGTAYDSNLTEKERARARQQLKDSGVELGTIIDDNPGKG